MKFMRMKYHCAYYLGTCLFYLLLGFWDSSVWMHVSLQLGTPLFELLILIDIWTFPVCAFHKRWLHKHSHTRALIHLYMHFCWYTLRRGHVEILSLTLLDNAKCFSKIFVSIYTSTNSIWEFSLLYILANTWDHQSFNVFCQCGACMLVSHCVCVFVFN